MSNILSCVLKYILRYNHSSNLCVDYLASLFILGENSKQQVRSDAIIIIFFMAHVFGFVMANIPTHLTDISEKYGYDTGTTIFYTLVAISALLLLFPYVVPFRRCDKSIRILNIFALLELASTLIGISMHNFSLGLFCATLSVPFALLLGPTTCG